MDASAAAAAVSEKDNLISIQVCVCVCVYRTLHLCGNIAKTLQVLHQLHCHPTPHPFQKRKAVYFSGNSQTAMKNIILQKNGV